MDVTKKAKEVSEKGGPYSTHKQNYEFMFLEGYNAAYEWFPIESAPKDGTHILLAHEWGDVGIGYWYKMGPYDCDTEEWCIQDSFDYGCESLTIFVDPVAWMPLPKYTHKP